MKVIKTNKTGDTNYYALGDVFWAVRPTEDDPGICYPKDDAIPRDAAGKPVASEDDFDYLDMEYLSK